MGFFDTMTETKGFSNEKLTFLAKVPVKMNIIEAKEITSKAGKTYFKLATLILDGEHKGKSGEVFMGVTLFSKRDNKTVLDFTFQKVIKALLKDPIRAAIEKAEKTTKDPDLLFEAFECAYRSNMNNLVGTTVEITYGPLTNYINKAGEKKQSQNINNIIKSEKVADVKADNDLEF